MNRFQRWMYRILPLVAGILWLQTSCLLIPDDTKKGEQVPNQRPQVRITAGAASPDSAGVAYLVNFQWVGSDRDGVVTAFQYAIDDTVSERAWRDTTGFSAVMRFRAATVKPDSVPREFTDWHTFYLRAIDNEFSVSAPDKRYFNARTIAPSSRITFPPLSPSEHPTLQRTVVVRWEGEDLDSSRPDKKPLFYEYKLVRIATSLDDSATVTRALLNDDNVLLDTLRFGSKSRWIRVPNTVKERTLNELPGELSYAFAVRAVDEAGAIEPVLRHVVNGNYIQFSVSSKQSQPRVTVNETSLGTVIFPGSPRLVGGSVWNVDVPAGRLLRFNWSGDASAYGSEAGNSNYALDVADPEDETLRDPRGIGGWIGWGRWTGNQTPFFFGNEEAGRVHTLYLYMRDVSDAEASTRKCTIRMRVVSFTLSNFALLVDDARWSAGGPTDTAHDRFIRNNIIRRLYDFGNVDSVSTYTDRPEGGQGASVTPIDVPLSKIAQYQNVIWSYNRASGQSGLRFTENSKRLSNYLGAGGRMFLFGGPFAGAERGGFRYPFEPPKPDDVEARAAFYFRFLYMRNTIGSAQVSETCDAQKSGMVAARSLNPAYPDLEIDREKWDPFRQDHGRYVGGLADWEGVKRGSSEALEQLPGLDSLYAVETFNISLDPGCGVDASPWDGSICSMRYESTHADSLLGRQHGRVIYFSFQPFFFQTERLADASTAAINWLVTGKDF